MLTWEQVTEISTCGVECGAHSHSHPELDVLPSALVQEELMRSKAMLQERIDQPVCSFAYPHGYYTPRVRQLVQQAGYSSACAVKHAMSSTNDDPFALARIIVSRHVSLEGFANLLAGKRLRVAPKTERKRTKIWRAIRFLRQRGRLRQVIRTLSRKRLPS